MRLLVIDGNSIANRAFFGIKLLTTKDGRYTNAIYGFLNILLSLLKECEPDEVAVAFDLKAPTFRHKMYDGYKATRHGMPEELAQQMPVLKELLADLGYRTVTAEGWEADDILGTLAAARAARLCARRSGKGAKYTRTHTALGFAYLEACADKSAALRREIALKKLTKAQKEALCAGWTAEKE